MEKQVTSTPPGMGGGVHVFHYGPPVNLEPAINVDMVNIFYQTACRESETVSRQGQPSQDSLSPWNNDLSL